MSRPARTPVVITLILSMGIAGAALAIMVVLEGTYRASAWAIPLAAIGALVGFFLGAVFRLGVAWRVLAAIAIPALILIPAYQPPNWIFPIIFVAIAGFYINGVTERVPLYLSNANTCDAVANLLPRSTTPTMIDLGCGLGDVILSVAKSRPDAQVIGVETAPLTFLLAWLRIKVLGPANVGIRFQSLWTTDVSDADMVYAFLSPVPMERLNEKLRAEMKAGSIFVSNSFAVPGREPDVVVPVDDTRQTRLLVWQM